MTYSLDRRRRRRLRDGGWWLAIARWAVVTLAILAPIFYTGFALLCYSCNSTTNKNCGPFFKPHGIGINHNCTGVCALQRQKAIPRIGQVEGIRRGCFEPDPLIVDLGLNSSVGCRWWTNHRQNFTAYYCFCDRDLCNAAARTATSDLLLLSARLHVHSSASIVGVLLFSFVVLCIVR